MSEEGSGRSEPVDQPKSKTVKFRKGQTTRFVFEEELRPSTGPIPRSGDDQPPVQGVTTTNLMHPTGQQGGPAAPPGADHSRIGPRVSGSVQTAAHADTSTQLPRPADNEDPDDRNTSDLRKILSRSQGSLAGGSGSIPAAKSSGHQKAVEQTGPGPATASGLRKATDLTTQSPAPVKSGPATEHMRLDIEVFGDYELKRRMAAGGFGEVWVAAEIESGRNVVLKRLKPEQAENKRAFYQFDIEIEIGTRIKHPNLVPVINHGVVEGRRFFTMPYITGPSLTRVLERKVDAEWHMSKPEMLRAVEFVCRALGFLHRARVIHCDIKPDNILFESKVRPKLIDLGIARTVDWEQTGYRALKGFREDNSILGTPEYMAPELFEGDWRTIGYPADLYSIGVVLYEILGGRPPFRRNTTVALNDRTTAILDLAKQIQHDQVQPLLELEPATPPGLAELAMQCLSKDPLKRPGNADQVAVTITQGLQALENSGRMTQLERMTRMLRNPGSRPPSPGGTI